MLGTEGGMAMVHTGKGRQSDRPFVPADAGETVRSADGSEVVMDDGAQEATDELVEALTERAELAERVEEASWFQNHPDGLFLAGVLAVIPSVWAKVRRVVRPRARSRHSAQHAR
jgi:hypothetical protein